MSRSSRSRWVILVVLVAVLASACGSTRNAATENAVPAVERSDAPTTATTTTTPPSPPPSTTEEPAFEGSGASDGALVLLTAAEIEVLLAGNTIIGNWVGEDYRQFFDQNGTTTYRPTETGRDSVGEWRVNVDSGLYESLWNDRPPWEDYEVHQDGDTFFWTGQGVQLSPFTVVDGNQLAAPR